MKRAARRSKGIKVFGTDLVVLPAWSLPASDISRGAFGYIAELEEDEGVLLAKAFSVGQVTALDRNNDQFSCKI